jgi:hypothetical protein
MNSFEVFEKASQPFRISFEVVHVVIDLGDGSVYIFEVAPTASDCLEHARKLIIGKGFGNFKLRVEELL